MKPRKRKIATAATLAIAAFIAALVITRFLFFDLLVVNGHSMSPTIRNGDRILVNKRAYRQYEPERGDIIAFSAEDGRILVKRIVGLPDDLIEVRNGILYRNGEEVSDEPYVEFLPQSRRRRSYRSHRMEDGYLFVMGDNRALSIDSKDFGPISYRDVIGKVVFIYFPPGRVKRLGT